MAAHFLDTSGLVKRYVAEVGSAWVTGITNPMAGHSVWIASVTRVELLAALYRRVRTGTLSLLQAKQAELLFRHELSTHFQPIPTDTPLLDQAMLLVASHPLRASSTPFNLPPFFLSRLNGSPRAFRRQSSAAQTRI